MNPIDQYLTINQMAKACSISRSSLLRMEEEGLLTPAYVNPENGYRYYDSNNVLRVIRIHGLQELGITHREMQEYFQHPSMYHNLLDTLQNKLVLMEQMISQINLLLKRYPHLSISKFQFAESYCYTFHLSNFTDVSAVRPYIWPTINAAIREGYSVDKNKHPFVIVNRYEANTDGALPIGHDYQICIPVLPGKDPSALQYFAPTQTISCILYGGFQDAHLAYEKLSQEIQQKHLIPTGDARIIAAVDSYPGEEVPREYLATQICIPIE